MIDFNDFSTEIFQILRSYGKDMVLYDDAGARVFEPEIARRFYIVDENILVSIKEDGDNSSLNLYLSQKLNLNQAKGFIDMLRNVTIGGNLLFHVKKFNKDIKPQDFASAANVNEQRMNKMNIMEGLYGTSKSSYLKLENARMIVRHSARVNENMIGGRGRNINSIFVENAAGERQLFPVNILSGARAMTQHVNQGGTFADEVGSQIIRMAQDFRNLTQVAGRRQNVAIPEAYVGLRESTLQAMKSIKHSFYRISESKSYLKETTKLQEGLALMEGSEDQLQARIMQVSEILGEGVNDEILNTLGRLTKQDETPPESQDDVKTTTEVKEDDTLAVKEGHLVNDSITREFDEWMESFTVENIVGRELDEFVESDKQQYTDRAAWVRAVRSISGAQVDMNKATLNGKVVAEWNGNDGYVVDAVDYSKIDLRKAKDHMNASGAYDFEPVKEETEIEEPINRELLTVLGYNVLEQPDGSWKVSKDDTDIGETATSDECWQLANNDNMENTVVDESDITESKNHMGDKEYHSYASWKVACKNAADTDVWIDGDKDIAQAMVGEQPFVQGKTHAVGEWDGEIGIVFKTSIDEGVDNREWFKDKIDWEMALLTIEIDDDSRNYAMFDGHVVARWLPERDEGWVDMSNKINEGKSFKRNGDDNKKDQDQERKEAAKKKRDQSVVESTRNKK